MIADSIIYCQGRDVICCYSKGGSCRRKGGCVLDDEDYKRLKKEIEKKRREKW